MSDLSKTEIERRALAILESLADDPDDADLRTRLLENEDAGVVERVLKITDMAAKMDAMPTELPASAADPPLPPPERFGVFRFVAPIGQGGMGEVWRGERDDGLFDQTVAIKLIQPHLQIRAGEAFESERRILARLEHPNIARMIDGGATDDGRACFVMEFIDGVPFDVGCASLPLDRRIAIFRQALDAVGYAHGRLIAHGDLKPSNILVEADARARLLDFGIARLVTDEASSVLLSGAVTSSFASPARLAGEPPSIPDDVFALGRLLQIVIGKDGDTDLAAIAQKSAAPDEASRYANVSELSADLDRWARHLPVKALPQTAIYVSKKFIDRQWKAIAAVILLGAALGYAGFNYLQTQEQRVESSARFEDARGASRYLLFTLYDELTDHPNTLKLRREIASTAQHYLARLAASHSAAPEVHLDAARGYLRLAQIEASPQLPNVGEPGSAKANLEAALTSLSTLHGPEAKTIAGQVELELANNADMIEEDDKSSERHLQLAKAKIDAMTPPDPLMAARYLTILSSVEQWKNEPKPAIDAARGALSLLANDNSLQALLRKSNAAELEGDGVYFTDKMASIPKYRQALEYAQQAVKLYPQSYAARRRLGITYFDVGTILNILSDHVEGLQRLQQAIDVAHTLIAFEPDDDNLRRSLSITERSMAQALAANGRVDEGLALMQKVVGDNKQRLDAHPDEYRRIRDYGVAELGLGNLLLKYKRTEPGCASLERAQAVFERMGKDGHLSTDDRQKQLGGIVKTRKDSCGQGSVPTTP